MELFGEAPYGFPEWLHHVIFPPAMCTFVDIYGFWGEPLSSLGPCGSDDLTSTTLCPKDGHLRGFNQTAFAKVE